MDTSQKLLIDTLKKHGYSASKSRLAVFSVLLHQEPLSMSEIVHKLSGIVDRATVYRTIELFEKVNVVQRLHIGWKYKIELTDQFHEHHHHIICQNCAKLIAIDGDSHIEKDIADLAKKYSFSITSHQLEIKGICKTCQLLDV